MDIVDIHGCQRRVGREAALCDIVGIYRRSTRHGQRCQRIHTLDAEALQSGQTNQTELLHHCTQFDDAEGRSLCEGYTRQARPITIVFFKCDQSGAVQYIVATIAETLAIGKVENLHSDTSREVECLLHGVHILPCHLVRMDAQTEDLQTDGRCKIQFLDIAELVEVPDFGNHTAVEQVEDSVLRLLLQLVLDGHIRIKVGISVSGGLSISGCTEAKADVHRSISLHFEVASVTLTTPGYTFGCFC